MPRFTLHRPKSPPQSSAQDSQKPPKTAAAPRETETANEVPEGLRSDPRVKIIDEMPRLVLIECPKEAAAEWLEQMPGWKLQEEQRAKIPNPRPKLK